MSNPVAALVLFFVVQCIALAATGWDDSKYYKSIRKYSDLTPACHAVNGEKAYSKFINQANLELGLPPLHRHFDRKAFDHLFTPNFGAALFSQYNGTIAYATIFKADSENIFFTLSGGQGHWSFDLRTRMMLLSEAGAKYNATPKVFTFIRDPLSHFVSGVVECYTRFHFRKAHPSAEEGLALQNSSEARATLKRARKIIESIVSLDSASRAKYISHDVTHYGNQVHTLLEFQPEFIGHLEDMQQDWGHIMAELGAKDVSLRQEQTHAVTSGDLLGIKRALLDLFHKEPRYLRAVCRFLIPDYLCLRYPLPEPCRDMELL